MSSRDLREEGRQATDRTSRARAYFTGYRIGVVGEARHLTDIDMAYAWLYQDVAHGDEVSTGYFDVKERYKAAVGVFSHMAVVAIETMHYINDLVELGIIELPVGTFSDPVVVTDNEYVMRAMLIETEVGDDLIDPEIAAAVPHLPPACIRTCPADGRAAARRPAVRNGDDEASAGGPGDPEHT